ncbi:hypothetical protein CDAR_250651 [Caerostris darwini]|uniref:Uncharacterized protein n=1 Tax=Caerostris darwini TaxID=1538125 RepID=A0AAV4RS32_9ARAC|nr:hypothetical protein CDAR_250651 [Caerostris darwini]
MFLKTFCSGPLILPYSKNPLQVEIQEGFPFLLFGVLSNYNYPSMDLAAFYGESTLNRQSGRDGGLFHLEMPGLTTKTTHGGSHVSIDSEAHPPTNKDGGAYGGRGERAGELMTFHVRNETADKRGKAEKLHS